MAALVTEMPEQRAIRLVKRETSLLSLRIVGFSETDRNEATMVPRHDLLVWKIGLEVEREPGVEILELRGGGQTEREDGVYQATLCGLEPEPRLFVSRHLQIRNRRIQSARTAKVVRIVLTNRPVTDRVLSIVRT
jgi:hypothetical protein